MRVRALAVVVAAGLALGGCAGGFDLGFGGGDDAPALPAGPAAVMSVERVSVSQASPTGILVRANGTARTGGWSDVRLVQETGGADEIVLRLVGTPPAEMATQALTPVEATTVIDPLPAGAVRVRVIAETGSVTERAR